MDTLKSNVFTTDADGVVVVVVEEENVEEQYQAICAEYESICVEYQAIENKDWDKIADQIVKLHKRLELIFNDLFSIIPTSAMQVPILKMMKQILDMQGEIGPFVMGKKLHEIDERTLREFQDIRYGAQSYMNSMRKKYNPTPKKLDSFLVGGAMAVTAGIIGGVFLSWEQFQQASDAISSIGIMDISAETRELIAFMIARSHMYDPNDVLLSKICCGISTAALTFPVVTIGVYVKRQIEKLMELIS
ncbi:MAG: hypothetical protein WC806_05970 [Candidatus Gracilibacteria bacterium]|jgi:hypothetical protein